MHIARRLADMYKNKSLRHFKHLSHRLWRSAG